MKQYQTSRAINKELEAGDKITCKGATATIANISYQDYDFMSDSFNIEFLDTNGVFRSWKQNIDGGTVK